MLQPRQNGNHFADHILKCIFFGENLSIFIHILLTFVPRDSVNNMCTSIGSDEGLVQNW